MMVSVKKDHLALGPLYLHLQKGITAESDVTEEMRKMTARDVAIAMHFKGMPVDTAKRLESQFFERCNVSKRDSLLGHFKYRLQK